MPKATTNKSDLSSNAAYVTSLACMNVFRRVVGDPNFPREGFRPQWEGGQTGRFVLKPVKSDNPSSPDWGKADTQLQGAAVISNGVVPDFDIVAEYEAELVRTVDQYKPSNDAEPPKSSARKDRFSNHPYLEEENYRKKLLAIEREADGVLFFDDDGDIQKIYCNLAYGLKNRHVPKACFDQAKAILKRIIIHSDCEKWAYGNKPRVPMSHEIGNVFTTIDYIAMDVARQKAGKSAMFMYDLSRSIEYHKDLRMAEYLYDHGGNLGKNLSLDMLGKAVNSFFTGEIYHHEGNWPGQARAFINRKISDKSTDDENRKKLVKMRNVIIRERNRYVQRAMKNALRTFRPS